MYKTQYQEQNPIRIDKFLSNNLKELSRVQIQDLIKQGLIYIEDKKVTKTNKIIFKGQIIYINFDDIKQEIYRNNKNDVNTNIEIIFEHKDFLVINKPAGLLVHKTNNPNSFSLVEILKEKYTDIKGVSEPLESRNDGNYQDRDGIVHRIDKDTSGLLIVVRNMDAYYYFKNLFKERQIIKKYIALVYGDLKEDYGVINFPIARSKVNHAKRIAIKNIKDSSFYDAKRIALTEYKVIQRLKTYTLLEVLLHTGRTHQIRVHLKAINHPIIGDKLYAGRLDKDNKILNRQFLHCSELEFEYLGQKFKFTSNLPEDLIKTLNYLDKLIT